MRFLLYNIRYGAGTGTSIHFPLPYIGFLKRTNGNLRHIIDFIKSQHPDFIGLVEVDSGSFRSENHNQAETIARELNFRHVYHSKYANTSLIQKMPLLNKQGNAFLTNRKIKRKKFHYLNSGIKRLVMELEMEDFVVFLVHLSLKYRDRQNQLKDLCTMVQRIKKPVLVAGDFNVLRGEKEIEPFMAATGFKNVNDQGRPSHPSRYPRRQLDFILYSPQFRVKQLRLPLVDYSDHIPLVLDFELKKPRKKIIPFKSAARAMNESGDRAAAVA